ncbi:hypothetical protein ACWF82_02380 [Nocardia sp. NPDC055053]
MEPDTLYRSAIRPTPRRYTVVVWSAGRLARHLAAAVGEHPGLDLLAVRTDPHPGAAAHGEQTATLRTTEDVLTLAPDCVLYMPRVLDTDTVCRMLMAGINVITTRSDLHHPDSMERTLCARLESACWAGRASLHSTGVSPGSVTELMPITIGAVQRRVDTVTIEEYTDLTHSDPAAPLPGIAGCRQPRHGPARRLPGDLVPRAGPRPRVAARTQRLARHTHRRQRARRDHRAHARPRTVTRRALPRAHRPARGPHDPGPVHGTARYPHQPRPAAVGGDHRLIPRRVVTARRGSRPPWRRSGGRDSG